MAKLGNVNISFEIEPIIKVKCLKSDCIHNLDKRGFAGCNLKYIDINSAGECQQCGNNGKAEEKQLLRKIAGQLELWVLESREGGWSTHQTKSMKQKAKEIYNLLGKEE